MKETVLGLNRNMKFYFCPVPVNMNKGIDGLCGFIRSNLMRDPLSSEVFIFMGKNRKQIKLLKWENGRFILYTVRLYGSKRFAPQYNNEKGNYYLDWKQFIELMD